MILPCKCPVSEKLCMKSVLKIKELCKDSYKRSPNNSWFFKKGGRKGRRKEWKVAQAFLSDWDFQIRDSKPPVLRNRLQEALTRVFYLKLKKEERWQESEQCFRNYVHEMPRVHEPSLTGSQMRVTWADLLEMGADLPSGSHPVRGSRVRQRRRFPWPSLWLCRSTGEKHGKATVSTAPPRHLCDPDDSKRPQASTAPFTCVPHRNIVRHS